MKPVTYIRHPRFDYVLTSDYEVRVPWECGNHDFKDAKGRVWLSMRGKLVIVRKGYAWDGATMAPDLPGVVLASCIHDALLQFRDVPCFPLSKAQIDKVFRDEMPPRLAVRWIYWGAVRAFGGIYGAVRKPPAGATCGLPHGR